MASQINQCHSIYNQIIKIMHLYHWILSSAIASKNLFLFFTFIINNCSHFTKSANSKVKFNKRFFFKVIQLKINKTKTKCKTQKPKQKWGKKKKRFTNKKLGTNISFRIRNQINASYCWLWRIFCPTKIQWQEEPYPTTQSQTWAKKFIGYTQQILPVTIEASQR